MRNLILLVLGVWVAVLLRRVLRGQQKGGIVKRDAQRAPQAPAVVAVLPCAHCQVLVPETEGVQQAGHFFCCAEHAAAGVQK